MSLNIKDPEVHELAQALAKATGESMTQAVREALRARLAGLASKRAPQAKLQDVLAIGRRCAAQLKGKPIDHATLLYDARGLPK
jgi:antitoxin VapB